MKSIIKTILLLSLASCTPVPQPVIVPVPFDYNNPATRHDLISSSRQLHRALPLDEIQGVIDAVEK